ncbi:MAG: hypothetical protein IPG07_04260 [Crocinitomicaceae bacterium]|nr:hypothetical protein [Crocinitomicaceae bacterium]
MKLDNDFNIILSGHSFSNISGNKTENSYGSRDYWVVKVNQFGSILWDKTLGGDLADEYPYLGVTDFIILRVFVHLVQTNSISGYLAYYLEI